MRLNHQQNNIQFQIKQLRIWEYWQPFLPRLSRFRNATAVTCSMIIRGDPLKKESTLSSITVMVLLRLTHNFGAVKLHILSIHTQNLKFAVKKLLAIEKVKVSWRFSQKKKMLGFLPVVAFPSTLVFFVLFFFTFLWQFWHQMM